MSTLFSFKRVLTSTLFWELLTHGQSFFLVQTLICEVLVPKKTYPDLRGGLRGPPRGQPSHFATFSHFFSTKPVPEPKLGGLGGSSGSQKIGIDPTYHPKKTGVKKVHLFSSYSRFDVSPLFAVDDRPLLGGNNVDKYFFWFIRYL